MERRDEGEDQLVRAVVIREARRMECNTRRQRRSVSKYCIREIRKKQGAHCTARSITRRAAHYIWSRTCEWGRITWHGQLLAMGGAQSITNQTRDYLKHSSLNFAPRPSKAIHGYILLCRPGWASLMKGVLWYVCCVWLGRIVTSWDHPSLCAFLNYRKLSALWHTRPRAIRRPQQVAAGESNRHRGRAWQPTRHLYTLHTTREKAPGGRRPEEEE